MSATKEIDPHEAIREYMNERRRKREREYSRKWRESNREKCRESDRKWREANPEKVREKNRKWHKANPENNREKARKWSKANPDKVRDRGASQRKKLKLAYVAKTLGLSAGIAKEHPDLLEAKRDQLKILRELRQQTRKNNDNAQESKKPARSKRQSS